MSLLLIVVLCFLSLYISTSIAYIVYYYFKSNKLMNCSIKLKVNRFFIHQREIVKARVLIKGPKAKLDRNKLKADVAIAIDYSGSMHGKSLEHARWGALTFVKNARIGAKNMMVGIVAFNHESMILSDLKDTSVLIKKAIHRIPAATGGTSILNGLQSADAILESSKRKKTENVQKIIILLTDGYDGESDKIIAVAKAIKEKGTRIFCIGIQGADEGLLKKLSENQEKESQAFYSTHPKDIIRFFEKINQYIVVRSGKDAQVEIDLNHRNMTYVGTTTEHLIESIEPLKWSIPWLKPQTEEIHFQFSPMPCIGLYPVTTQPITMRFVDDDNQKQNISNAHQPYVLVMPFYPTWLAAILIHPLLWNLLYTKLCPHKEIEFKQPHLPKIIDIELGDVPDLEPQQPQKWHPTFCIALGGGGIASGLRFKALIQDAWSGENFNHNFHFLNIDTDHHFAQKPYYGGAELENLVTIGADLWEEHLNTIKDPKRHIWYPYRQNESLDRELFDTRYGCSNNRYLGRLSLHYFLTQQPKVLLEKIEKAIRWLKECEQIKKCTPQIMIFTTPTGGTGSAIFHDIMHLLLTELEKQTMENKLQVLCPIVDNHDYRESVNEHYFANYSAFLLELERIKSSIRFSPDLADYPGAKALNISRFSNAEYFIPDSKEDSTPIFSATACLALSLANANGDFFEKVQQEIIYHLKLNGNNDISGVISATVSSQFIPISLCRDYLQIKFIQQLLQETQGIQIKDDLFTLHLSISNEETIKFIEYLLLGKEMKGYEVLKTEIPLSFEYILALYAMNKEGLHNEDIFISVLKKITTIKKQKQRKNNLEITTIRLLEWCFNLLTQRKNKRLACVLHTLEKLEDILFVVLDTIQNKPLNLELPIEQLLFYSKPRLTALNQLFYDYVHIVQVLTQHLRTWTYSLTEGYPVNWVGNNQWGKHHVSKNFVGLARRYARKIEIIYECLDDYPSMRKHPFKVIMDKHYNSRLKAIGGKKIDNIKNRISWSTVSQLKTKQYSDAYEEIIEKHENPFCLQISKKTDSVQLINNPITEQQQLETALLQLSEYGAPWIRKDDILGEEPLELHPENDNLRYIQYLDSEFSMGSVKVKIALNSHQQWRESVFYSAMANHPAFTQGKRNHVLKTDMRSAMIQRIYSQNRPLEKPNHPLVAYLMEDLHYLQFYLYSYLKGQVQLMNHPANSRRVWVFEDTQNQEKYYLTHTSEHSEFEAAIQYVLRKKCLLNGADIIIDANWRPDAATFNLLEAHLKSNADTFLEYFSMVMNVMHEKNGYFQPFSEVTTKYI